MENICDCNPLFYILLTGELFDKNIFNQSIKCSNLQSGLAGSLWYCIGIVVGILVFPTLSVFIKSRAPGAKTYPQVGEDENDTN